ncbi:MAG: hypothetical protein MJ105_08190 [Lachnospiraceae bacterium]|nr:hypothetical protein [Lachnospiraceae bacterium]
MACFVVPGAEAIVTTIATKIVEHHELKHGDAAEAAEAAAVAKEKVSTKLKRLNLLLYGGTALLAFEHFWHGEIQPFFPFLTAAENADSMAGVLHEMSTVGVGMAVLVTGIWGIMTAVLHAKDKKLAREAENSATV